MYNLIEYSHNYSKASGNLYQCYRNKSFLDYNEAIASFLVNNNSVLLKVKTSDIRTLALKLFEGLYKEL